MTRHQITQYPDELRERAEATIQRAFDDLRALGAEELQDPTDPRWHDLKHQGITATQYHRMQDTPIAGEYL